MGYNVTTGGKIGKISKNELHFWFLHTKISHSANKFLGQLNKGRIKIYILMEKKMGRGLSFRKK